MDPLMLDSAVRALARNVEGLEVRAVREESPHRIRWVLQGEAGPRSMLLCIEPGKPWVARPHGAWPETGRHPGPLSRALQGVIGLRLVDLTKDPLDRRLRMTLSDRSVLIVELLPQRPNATLLDPDGTVRVSARVPKSDQDRLAHGVPYRPPTHRQNAVDLRGLACEELERLVQRALAGGGSRALERGLHGLGSAGARWVSARGGRRVPELAAAVRELFEGIDAAAIVPGLVCRLGAAGSRRDRIEALREGRVDPADFTLEWIGSAQPDRLHFDDAAATVGLYYEARARHEFRSGRERGLRNLLAAEARRVAAAAARAEQDASGFADPSRHRKWGEALLAGLARARIEGARAEVIDPYGDGSALLDVPIDPAVSLQQNAERHFASFRRAERGVAQARTRAEALRGREARLAELATLPAGSVSALERGLRSEGVPVGLDPGAAISGVGKGERQRLTGIRVYTDAEGWELLVGRSAKENHRLTFKLAGPEDYWFHALGVTGAHVILRLPARGAKPTPESIREAAAIAAWFSESRRDEHVDVQYTRRKFVRRPRGSAAGTVVLKRFETIRVRPANPDPLESGR